MSAKLQRDLDRVVDAHDRQEDLRLIESVKRAIKPIQDCQGYKLIGPRAWETAGAIILERKPPAVRAE